jgi:hypothetical protein
LEQDISQDIIRLHRRTEFAFTDDPGVQTGSVWFAQLERLVGVFYQHGVIPTA